MKATWELRAMEMLITHREIIGEACFETFPPPWAAGSEQRGTQPSNRRTVEQSTTSDNRLQSNCWMFDQRLWMYSGMEKAGRGNQSQDAGL